MEVEGKRILLSTIAQSVNTRGRGGGGGGGGGGGVGGVGQYLTVAKCVLAVPGVQKKKKKVILTLPCRCSSLHIEYRS